MEIYELMLLTDDLIDYRNLSEDILKKLALGEELFIATSALGELASRHSRLAETVAWKILEEARGDRYLQAAALEKLYNFNPALTKIYMSKNAEDCDRYIFNTIMIIALENQSDFQAGLALSVVRRIASRLKKMNDEEKFIDPQVRDNFLKFYSSIENVQTVNLKPQE